MAVDTQPPKSQIWNVPNMLTIARFGLALVLFGLIAYGHWISCIILFTVAAFTDWLDGYLARVQNQMSPLGRNLDPLVDKVLICGAFIFLLPIAHAGLTAWMVTVVVARELIITGLRSFMENRGATFGADWLGKFKMGLQCAALLAIFLMLALGDEGEPLRWPRDIIIWAMVAVTALSGAQYLWRAGMLLKDE